MLPTIQIKFIHTPGRGLGPRVGRSSYNFELSPACKSVSPEEPNRQIDIQLDKARECVHDMKRARITFDNLRPKFISCVKINIVGTAIRGKKPTLLSILK